MNTQPHTTLERGIYTNQSITALKTDNVGPTIVGETFENSSLERIIPVIGARSEEEVNEHNRPNIVEDNSWENDDFLVSEIECKCEYDSDGDLNFLENQRAAKRAAEAEVNSKDIQNMCTFNWHSLNAQLTALGYNYMTFASKCAEVGETKCLQNILQNYNKTFLQRTKRGVVWGDITFEMRIQTLVVELHRAHPQHNAAKEYELLLTETPDKITKYLEKKEKTAQRNTEIAEYFSPEVIKSKFKKWATQFKGSDRRTYNRDVMLYKLKSQQAPETQDPCRIYYCLFNNEGKFRFSTQLKLNKDSKRIVEIRGFTARGGRIASRNAETTYVHELQPTSKKFIAYRRAFSHGLETKDMNEFLETAMVRFILEMNGDNSYKRSDSRESNSSAKRERILIQRSLKTVSIVDPTGHKPNETKQIVIVRSEI